MSKNWLDDLVDASPAASHIAYAGEIEFAGCTEDDRTGRTVTFLLRREKEDLLKAHPFSAHTRRRRGHAGTQFEMSLASLNEKGNEPIGMFSVMLLNWGASPKGETVKFLLGFEQEKHPFLVCQRAGKDQPGTCWMAAFIETDDQSQAVNQKQREKVEQAATLRKPKQQIKNSNLAAQFIKNPRFWEFLNTTFGYRVKSTMEADGALKALTEADSKSQFDQPGIFGIRFNDLREEFVEWQLKTYGAEGMSN